MWPSSVQSIVASMAPAKYSAAPIATAAASSHGASGRRSAGTRGLRSALLDDGRFRPARQRAGIARRGRGNRAPPPSRNEVLEPFAHDQPDHAREYPRGLVTRVDAL